MIACSTGDQGTGSAGAGLPTGLGLRLALRPFGAIGRSRSGAYARLNSPYAEATGDKGIRLYLPAGGFIAATRVPTLIESELLLVVWKPPTPGRPNLKAGTARENHWQTAGVRRRLNP